MVGLTGARVLVLDDEAEEAGAILKALSKTRIPAVWFTGEVSQLPEETIPNVRLALLDVDLTGGGLATHQLVPALVNVLIKLLPKDAAGLNVVLWTKHPELRDELLQRLLDVGGPIPTFVDVLSKAEFKDANGDFDLRKLIDRLTGAMALIEPWPTMIAWEGGLREAVAQSLSEIAALAEGEARPTDLGALDLWQVATTKTVAVLLRDLAAEELGPGNVSGPRKVLEGAFAVLSQLVVDASESSYRDVAETRGDTLTDLFESVKEGKLPDAIRSRINGRLVLSRDRLDRLWTGNVYRVATPLLPASEVVFPGESLVDEYVQLIAKPKPKDGTQEAHDELLKKVKEGVFEPLLIEVNPPCDHAQQKVGVGRFLTAVRIRSGVLGDTKLIRSLPDSLWRCGPLSDSDGEGDYHLIADLRRPLVSSLQALRDATPIARVRQSFAMELLAQTGAHGSRPGVSLLRSKK